MKCHTGSSPVVGTTFTGEIGHHQLICTNLAQTNARNPDRRVRFPVTIRHRTSKAKIYAPGGKFPYYRLAYIMAGKRRMRTFPNYSDAKTAAEKIVRDLAGGSLAASLNATQSRDAFAALERLQSHFQASGRRVSLLAAVSDFVEASGKLGERTLGEAVEGFLSSVVSVKRKNIKLAVTEFCDAREPKALALPGKRSALNPTYVADTSRRLNEFADAFPGSAVSELTKAHLDAFVGSHQKLSPKSRNHLRTTVRMFLGWCARRDYLASNHRLLETDGLQAESLDNAPIDFYRPNELRALLENSTDQMRPNIALQALAGLRLQETLRLDWCEVFGIGGHIEVSSSKSKTRQRRLVEMCPALEQWLAPYRKKQGNLTTQTLNGYTAAFTALRKSLKIPSRRNGLRHGFVTYHFALNQNENATSALAGNSPAMIHGHYKGLATKAEAGKWFAVRPEK